MRYAVLFTTYVWDDFVARQYAHLKQRVAGGDLFVMIDESAHKVPPLPIPNVIRTSQADIAIRCKLPALRNTTYKRKNPLWWNVDYLTYRFFTEHADYDYCVTLDYDARLNIDIDQLVTSVATENYDFVALPVANDLKDWAWQSFHKQIYGEDKLYASLLCAMVISKNAAQYLLLQRRKDAADYARNKISFWPFCEAFVPTQLARGGFRIGNLSQFTTTSRLGWHKVWCEDDRASVDADGIIHPVMNRPRFLKAILHRHEPSGDIFNPTSQLRQDLKKYPLTSYLHHLVYFFANNTVKLARRIVDKTYKERFLNVRPSTPAQ